MIVFRFLTEKLDNIRQVGVKTMLFRLVTKLPYVRGKVAAEGEKIMKQYTEQYSAQRKGAIKVLPEKPLSHNEIMKRINEGEIQNRKCYIDGGRISGAVYVADDKHW